MDMSDNNILNEGAAYDSWSCSDLKHRFAWKIEKFTEKYDILRNKKSLSSTIYHVHGLDGKETHWRLLLRRETSEGDDFLSAFIINVTSFDVRARFQFSILDSAKNLQNIVPLERISLASSVGGGGRKFVKYSTLTSQASQLLPNDSLTFVCDITITSGKKPACISEFMYPAQHLPAVFAKFIPNNTSQLGRDLKTMFTNKEQCDVRIHCKGKIFDCHQLILSARSPVFKAMFQADMLEKETQKVHLVDLDPEVVSEMLHFVYTGETNKMEEFAEDLFAAADRYQLDQLKALYEESLYMSLKVENCVELFVIGDIYHADMLKGIAIKFIARNRGSLSKNNNWKETLKNYPALMMEVIEETFKEP